jgi:predicted phage baseplate assembly protein
VPIDSPQLDDLSYAKLRDLLVRRIPTVAPEWTDHNDSDPGIALVQLFAFAAEQVGYRLNRVPEKNYVEFMKLLGMQLKPARAAQTRLGFVVASPENATAFVVPRGSTVQASPPAPVPGQTPPEPPTFETDDDVVVVPAQLAALVTTQSANLRDIREGNDTALVSIMRKDEEKAYLAKRFSLVWDGKTPKLEELPVRPLPTFYLDAEKEQRHLWIGLAFNPALPAGFLGQRVTLTVQFDDDELPSAMATSVLRPQCAGEGPASTGVGATAGLVSGYEYYYRPLGAGEPAGKWQTLTTVSDTTEGWQHSGQIAFDVPLRMGAIPDGEWVDVRPEQTMTTEQLCEEAQHGTAPPLLKPIPHPLINGIKTPIVGAPADVPVSGWIHVAFLPSASAGDLKRLIRALTFNVAPATQATTVTGELAGRGNGLPGQSLKLVHGDILAGALELAVEDPLDGLLHFWEEVQDFDAESATSQCFTLDREAGVITFGDAIRGKPPADGARVVALKYRYGGGKAGDLGVGAISKLSNVPSQVQAAVNLVAASGGDDAESLAEAKARVPSELKARGRAVTCSDFEFLARETPGVSVGRAVVVPLRIPNPYEPGLDVSACVPGALSVVVVPDEEGLFPTPTNSMLRKVCSYLDAYRLVTTEVYAVAPQFVRLHAIEVDVKPTAGYTSVQVREAITAHLQRFFHVLTGGADGSGIAFGSTIHHADLVAQISRVAGVDRVDQVTALFNGQAPDGTEPAMSWRPERTNDMRLTACISDSSTEVSLIELFPDENVFVDATDLLVRVVQESA